MKYKLDKDASGLSLVYSKCVQKLSSYLWKGYSKLVEFLWGKRLPDVDRDPEYMENGFKLGTLSQDDINPLLSLLKQVPARKMNSQDCHSEYLNNPYVEDSKALFSDEFCYYDLSNNKDILRIFLSNYISKVRACLGYPARIVNVRCWGTRTNAREVGPDAWHSDHFAHVIHKILIYLTPAGPGKGTTEMRMKDGSVESIEGPAGSWVFFNPTNIIHRGVCPSVEGGERIIMEVTVTPALKDNFEPVFAGLNATYPWVPWTKI